jgi:hypothetical protein
MEASRRRLSITQLWCFSGVLVRPHLRAETSTMSTIEFFPSKSYSIRRYTLTRDGVEVGQIDCGGASGTATITIGGVTCTPVTDSVLRGKYHLEANGARIASAQSAGFWFRHFKHPGGRDVVCPENGVMVRTTLCTDGERH